MTAVHRVTEPLETTMATRVEFGSGCVLMPGARVYITHEYEDAYGIQWTDREGSHVAAVHRDAVYTPTFAR